jgi:N-acetylglucosaminyl-diphospho-decaprenol L-rhamnosyltransferase
LKDVSILIVNMNAAGMLRDCLVSLRETCGALRLEIILVDNGSKDDSLAVAKREWPEIVLLAQEKNIGYVRANNLGLPYATGRYFLYLNNDTVLLPQCLAELAHFLDTNPEAGAVSGQILNPDGTDQGTARTLPSIANAVFGRRSVLSRWFPGNRWTRRYMIGWQRTDQEPFEAEFLSTACLMVRTEIAKAIGGMDEEFVHYWVDAELCHRIRVKGWKLFCVPQAKVLHFEGQGGSNKTWRQRCRSTLLFHRDAYYAYVKIHGLQHGRPGALLAAALLGMRAGALMVLQILRPGRATVSGGRNPAAPLAR